jgi:hypothetical protein
MGWPHLAEYGYTFTREILADPAATAWLRPRR